MKVGDRIRVKESIKVYHHPEHKGSAFDIKGLEGEILQVIADWHGRPISPNYPLEVKLGNKFKAHVSEYELELISE
ncbi:ferredoxin-thioredoxin reductase variable chain [Tumidithrix elongata RA019]|uniref:Ferredoxin-thioredoxin reductase variable chain n=1 Tax=Tumidithrix elongata BACA0141 TaxID=2716417 RepID=A0AAW9Q3Z9_9CYAN|nr:ferredoxin-thioredoxin reductase variable chain [Tumidithrix elongata RA019]